MMMIDHKILIRPHLPPPQHFLYHSDSLSIISVYLTKIKLTTLCGWLGASTTFKVVMRVTLLRQPSFETPASDVGGSENNSLENYNLQVV